LRTLSDLFANNREWARAMRATDRRFFARLAGGQAPPYLWIGCSDSRVPANEIVGLAPGELFVHRNVANLAPPADHNVAAVLEFGLEVLGVEHVIVCGHTGCGGVQAVLQNRRGGKETRAWLEPVRRLERAHRATLAKLGPTERGDRLAELNVVKQVDNVSRIPAVKRTWARGRALSVHGWMYHVRNGRLEDLGLCVTAPEEVRALCQAAVGRLAGG
jgi:carbonic anhydrase